MGHAAWLGLLSRQRSRRVWRAGAVCTNDEALAAAIAKLKDHRAHEQITGTTKLGYGERLDGLQAAILGARRHLESWNAARRQHAA
ncbi:MAG: DegT/DnrJ/EryC1/StrS family aminotransferase [Chloroflexi bacterium]|nr:DegT/DnrJ/EryC1/StrS family aminotransferase [Chloroflexota bacterium]